MKGIKIIASVTFREGIRDRIYLIFFFFAIILLLFSLFLSMLVIGDPTKVIADFGMGVMSLLGILIVIFVGGPSFSKELQKRTVISVLSKPISREEFLVGKLFGIWSNVFVNLLAMAVLLFLLILAKGVMIWGIFVQAFLLFLEMGILTAVDLMFSSFTTSFLAMLFTLSFYVVVHLTTTIEKASQSLSSPISKAVVRYIAYLLPNFDYFNLKNQVVYGLNVPPLFYCKSFVYFLALIIFFTILAVWVFKKKEI